MEKLQQGDLQTFELLLRALMSPNNDALTQSQTTLEQLQQNGDLAAQHFVQALRRSQSAELKNMAAVLMRRVREMTPLPFPRSFFSRNIDYQRL